MLHSSAMKQLSLFKISKSFGGELLVDKRKTYRPISSQNPIHLVMRSEEVLKCGGFKTHRRQVQELIFKYSQAYNIKIYSLVICSNHLHLVIRYQNKNEFQNFLRVISGLIAKNISLTKGFWLHRPFTRVLSWGRDFENALNYIDKNQLETDGLIVHKRAR